MPTDILAVVTKLIESRPVTPEKVSAVTGVTVTRQPESTAAFTIYRSPRTSAGSITQIELRAPGQGATAGGELTILDLNPGSPIRRAQVRERFGREAEITVPSPHEPADAPIYLIYQRPWGTLRFGFRRTGDEGLVTVVADATQPAGR
jgi:hypothetical protein